MSGATTTTPPVDCPHWSECGRGPGGGCCAIGVYGPHPSRGTCAVCQSEGKHGGPPVPRQQPLPGPDLTGYDPNTDPQSPRVGGCCDPPKG